MLLLLLLLSLAVCSESWEPLEDGWGSRERISTHKKPACLAEGARANKMYGGAGCFDVEEGSSYTLYAKGGLGNQIHCLATLQRINPSFRVLEPILFQKAAFNYAVSFSSSKRTHHPL